MKRILYLSFYFEPDLSAGAFRNTNLAQKLAEIGGEGVRVHIVTTQPNRYRSFGDMAPSQESRGNLIINRIDVPKHKSGFIDQIFSYYSFYRQAKSLVRGEKYDIVFASSSKMFTAYLGRCIAKKIGCRLYLDIRDIFVDTMEDVLKNRVMRGVTLPILRYFFERPTFNYASHINLVSEGFRDYFKKFPRAEYSFFPNGIDDLFLGLKQNPNLDADTKKFVITYAGNIGEGQGLHKIIPEAATLLGDKYRFVIIGDGGTRGLLEKEIENHNLKNVVIINPVARKELPGFYQNSHFLFLHLNNYKAFERVLPSKLFEYGATNLPVLAGVSGFPAVFINREMTNCIIFEPCNAFEFAEKLKAYRYRLEERMQFSKDFSRENINTELANSILKFLKRTKCAER